MRWKIAVSALALAGVAMIGAVFALRGGVPGLKKDAPFIAAAQGPTKVAPPSDQTVTTSSDAGATLLHDNGKPGLGQSRQFRGAAGRFERTGVGQQPASGAPPAQRRRDGRAALAATINTPLVAPQAAAPPKGMTSEFPDPKPVRTISLRPDGTPIGAVSPLDQPASDANAAPARASAASRASRPKRRASSRAEDDKRRDGRRAAVDAQDRIADQAFTAQVVGARGGRQNRYDRARGDRPDAARTSAELALRRNRKRRRRSRRPGKSPTRPRRLARSRRPSTRRPRRPRADGPFSSPRRNRRRKPRARRHG